MTDTPQLTHEEVAEIAQEHEAFLTQLEGLAIQAIASGDWQPIYELIASLETWQGEQALLEEKSPAEDPMKHLWSLVFPKGEDRG
jgi:hypothetical protein